MNFLLAMRETPGFTARDTSLALTTISFDIAALDIFLPLAAGGAIHMVSREVARDGRRLAEAIEESGATVVQATPATWKALLHAGWQGRPGLRFSAAARR